MSDNQVFCIAKSHQQAEQIVERLQSSGFPASEISILLPDTESRHNIGPVKATKAPEGATTGGVAGGVTGGVIGLLAGLDPVTARRAAALADRNLGASAMFARLDAEFCGTERRHRAVDSGTRPANEGR